MSESAAAARKAFGIRLRDMRKDARLTGRELAEATGMHPTKVSRIEHARQNPSEDDIRAWCIACGVARQIPEFIAVHREVGQMWVEHRQALRQGQRNLQAAGTPLYERTKRLCAYEAIVVPGILQTPSYVRELLTINAMLYGLPTDEIEAAVQARLSRQHLVTAGTGNRYSFVVESAVFGYVYGNAQVMCEQLDFLLTVTRLPNVALGIIPSGPARKVWGGECFYIFDDAMVRSDMWSGAFRASRPDEIAFFVKVFNLLREQAVYGHAARELIEAAKIRLQSGETF
ncbi:helix-turn-helix transcriptional regulator [Actinomadura fulvescens]|uniref:Helix-turn-helix transcriptional regulator n=1 Tax=Actinomadura fulvescens TaxID=46160 RepID=A0ABN3QD84_9ACTN